MQSSELFWRKLSQHKCCPERCHRNVSFRCIFLTQWKSAFLDNWKCCKSRSEFYVAEAAHILPTHPLMRLWRFSLKTLIRTSVYANQPRFREFQVSRNA